MVVNILKTLFTAIANSLGKSHLQTIKGAKATKEPPTYEGHSIKDDFEHWWAAVGAACLLQESPHIHNGRKDKHHTAAQDTASQTANHANICGRRLLSAYLAFIFHIHLASPTAPAHLPTFTGHHARSVSPINVPNTSDRRMNATVQYNWVC